MAHAANAVAVPAASNSTSRLASPETAAPSRLLVLEAQVVEVEGRGQDGLIGAPAELVAFVEVGDDFEPADP
jgi:hypothetical protein